MVCLRITVKMVKMVNKVLNVPRRFQMMFLFSLRFHCGPSLKNKTLHFKCTEICVVYIFIFEYYKIHIIQKIYIVITHKKHQTNNNINNK